MSYDDEHPLTYRRQLTDDELRSLKGPGMPTPEEMRMRLADPSTRSVHIDTE